MAIKAALLDERGVFLRMDEVPSVADLGPRHLPQIVSCDLPPGAYLWVPDERKAANGRAVNAYGGAFWEVAWLKRVAQTRRDMAKAHAVAVKRKRRVPLEPKQAGELGILVGYLEERGL